MTDEEKEQCLGMMLKSRIGTLYSLPPKTAKASPLNGEIESLNTAISDLRDRIARRNPQPLTLEELRGMDGEPVWLKDGIGEGYFLASAVVGSKIYFCEKSITVGEPLSECGRSWFAYRTKPEVSTHE